jgi:sugar lactone lactonase YvrE
MAKLLWAKSVGGEGDEEPRGIAVDAQGNIYVTGYFGEL